MFEGNQSAQAVGVEGKLSASQKVASRKNKSTRNRNGFWKRQARTWHWISGAVCLIGMLLFSITGITLNHASQISAEPVVAEQSFVLTDAHLSLLVEMPSGGATRGLPEGVSNAIDDALGVSLDGRRVEWTDVDAYIALPRPGGDSWLSIDRETGEVMYELTTRGAIAYLNDLHKGRNTGVVWSWFIDIFSVASILFCLTGLWLLQVHAGKRPSTWPLTLLGFALPFLLALFFIH